MKSRTSAANLWLGFVPALCAASCFAHASGRPTSADEALEWPRAQQQALRMRTNSVAAFLPCAQRGRALDADAQLDLPETFFDALREARISTRIEQADGALRAVVNDVMFNLEFTPSEIAILWIYAHQRIIVTARSEAAAFGGLLARVGERGSEIFRSPVELLVHLMRDQADLLVQIVRRTSADIDRIEDRFLSQRPTQNRLDLGAMRRMLTRLHGCSRRSWRAIFRLLARPPRWLHPEDVQDLRESTEEFSVVLDMAGLIERVRLLQRRDYFAARRTE